MDRRREEYVTPVGFAREPAKERRRWIGRFFLGLLVIGLILLVWTRVIQPPEDSNSPIQRESVLPAD